MSQHSLFRTSRSSGPRQRLGLRVGVLLRGHLVEERLLRQLGDVTIGQSFKNTLSIPVEGMPRTWRLFASVGGGYALCFSDAMDGRVSDGRGVYTLTDLKAGPAAPHRGGWALRLTGSARGKITLGDAAILFQVVPVPAEQPRPRLPQSVRGTLGDRINPLLGTIVAASVALHGVAAFWLHEREATARTRLEKISKNDVPGEPTVRAYTVHFPDPITLPPPVQPDASPGTGTPPPPLVPVGRRPSHVARVTANDDARLEARATATIQALTGRPGENGRYDSSSGVDPGIDLDRILRHNRDATISSRDPDGPGRLRDHQPDAVLGTGDAPHIDGPGSVDPATTGKDDAVLSRPDLLIVKTDDPGTTLDPEDVAASIRRQYLRGIRHCHESLLRTEPGAGGRVTIDITVGKTGNVIDATVVGFDAGVDQCISTLAHRWRFPAPTEDGKPAQGTYSIPFVLRPAS
jgi:hypothetical protein